jgi:hypothetical protein
MIIGELARVQFFPRISPERLSKTMTTSVRVACRDPNQIPLKYDTAVIPTGSVDIFILRLYERLDVSSYGCSIQNPTLITTHEPRHSRNDETNGNIEFLQPYPVVAADALLEIGTAVISAGLSLDEHLSQTNTSYVPKFCYQSVYCCLIRYFLVRIRIAKCFTNSSKRF